jgi:hypothetical protein
MRGELLAKSLSLHTCFDRGFRVPSLLDPSTIRTDI